jgi:DNA-directed RNA polymerase specialized sigma subunit
MTAAPRTPQNPRNTVNPFAPEFIDEVVAPLAARALSGECTRKLGDELYAVIHPWVLRYTARKARNLPPTADRDELRSRIMEAALLACRTIDFDRYETFSYFLRMRVAGAAIEAARHDDWLSRRHRRLLGTYRATIEAREQKLGRPLSDTEQREIAKELAPESKRVEWVEELTRQCAPTAWTPMLDNKLADKMPNPEDALVKNELRSIMQEWLSSLPVELSTAAMDWATENVDGQRGAPRPIIRQLRKHLPDLMARLEGVR